MAPTNDSHFNHHDLNDFMKEHPVMVIMLPFPSQSHMSQLLQLSHLISSSSSSSYHMSVHTLAWPFTIFSMVVDAHSIPDAETYAFKVGSSFTFFSFAWEAMGKPSLQDNTYGDHDDDHQSQTILNHLPSFEERIINSEDSSFFTY
ncbi:hypothetical protein FEM48_Zijuj11G0064800 [Ziziphus jujuba var. spinosa]|uniref:Glycosyltransferase N-terminal domain-containing protein n=1 Tax=Ziziphus jujuba var. spinosa TaxID=714518 RepID=A0A978UHD0_ZIZJJ|nr:hypothetical protein FEM48_Zijuj11G0064800 [Ziziphus jujuba var. spinosa]